MGAFYSKSRQGGKPKIEEPKGLTVFVGPYVHSESKENTFVICQNGVIGVENDKIVFMDVEDNLENIKKLHSIKNGNIKRLGTGEFLMPGLVDTHIHASQYPNAGLALNLGLLEWLDKYTFPMETKFHDPSFARSCYEKAVQKTLYSGTTTACYFATIHQDSSEVLGDICEEYGQRALIGKVCMDCHSPDTYMESTEDSLKATEDFVVNMLKKESKRVKPVITPRFALTCSMELMKGLAEIATRHDVFIQTHLCESLPEIARAAELFPDCKSYTEVYEKAGIASNKSIMAHCVHMSDDEIQLLVKTSTSVSHCPTSNMCLESGLCPVRRMMDAGVKVGLGTDVSGGYSANILEAMRHAILTSKCIKIKTGDYETLSYKDALYLATLGGAAALGMDENVGNFQVGKSFDALQVNLNCKGSPVHLFPEQDLEDMVQKFIMLGDDRNIRHVYVDGRKLK